MHELSIATAILDQVEREQAKYPGNRISRVGVRVGEISGVDPDALSFSFSAMVQDTAWAPLEIEIVPVPRRQRCRACAHEFTAPAWESSCPLCSERRSDTIAGAELQIAYVEVDDEPDSG